MAEVSEVLSILTGDAAGDFTDIKRHLSSQSAGQPSTQLDESDLDFTTIGRLVAAHVQTLKLLHERHVFTADACMAIEPKIMLLEATRSG